MNPYKILNINKQACKDEIKSSYRKKAKKVHPDHNGNSEEFDTINKAYRLLICDKKRARFDSGENANDILNKRFSLKKEVEKLIEESFISIVQNEQTDVTATDIVELIRKNFTFNLNNLREYINNENKKIEKLKESKKRIKFLKDKNNIFHEAIEVNISVLQRNLLVVLQNIKKIETALDFLDDFTYEIDSTFSNITFGSLTSTTATF